ncbi:uncharacterized protein LOC122826917 isoform X2 [Gambusia affinis]|uniref:uncharacterized protein LOC122826917 isoform X2 n=1 Tax=Gambusia affinis TaxID=33528 RepID=UPI001CDBD3F2|nr:uncharacterized protein LOC122826917 isoform X2 [Gambusia affinis]
MLNQNVVFCSKLQENKMFRVWGLVAFLCLHQRTFCSAFQTSRVEVQYGDLAVLHCDGSDLKEDGVVHWELRGEDVVILREGEAQVSEKFKGRVELPSEEQIREGNWSLVLRETRFRDADMYECIFGGATTVSTVWLSVNEPHVNTFITTFEDSEVDLACFIKPERENIKRFYWTMNGRFLIQHDHQTLSITTYKFPKSVKFNEEEFHLYLRPTRNESGKYQCWYTTGESESPKLALPESYTLTVDGLTTDPGNLDSFKKTTDVLPPSETTFDMEETNKNVWGSSAIFLLDVTTAAGISETPTGHLPVTLEMSTQIMEATESVETSSKEETRTSQETVTLLSDEVNAVEATGFPTELPGLLEDSTQLIQDVLPPSETTFDMEETNKNVWGSSVIFLLDVTTAAGISETPTGHLPVTLEMSTQIMEAAESVETSSEEETRTSQETVTLLSDEVNAVEATGFPTELPGLLEDSTQLIQDDGNLLPSDLTNTQQMETVEEKETFSDKDDLDASWSVLQLGDFPWVRIGIIGGVLLITVVVLCVLRALNHI